MSKLTNNDKPITVHHKWKSLIHIDGRWEFIRCQSVKDKTLCQVRHCRTFARVEVRMEGGRLRTARHSTCSKCRERRYRANHPEWALWRDIRNRAKSRGQEFTITLSDLVGVLSASSHYDDWRHGSGVKYHIDRIDCLSGYTPGNIRVITQLENLVKSADDKIKHQQNRQS